MALLPKMTGLESLLRYSISIEEVPLTYLWSVYAPIRDFYIALFL